MVRNIGGERHQRYGNKSRKIAVYIVHTQETERERDVAVHIVFTLRKQGWLWVWDEAINPQSPPPAILLPGRLYLPKGSITFPSSTTNLGTKHTNT